MALLDSRILKQYNCTSCAASGAKLYRVKYTDDLFCKQCAVNKHPEKKFYPPNTWNNEEHWVSAIPSHLGGKSNDIMCYCCDSSPADKVRFWESLPDYSQRKLKDTLRSWRNV